MQNREELGQKGHDESQKTVCCERGKKIIFRRGGGINIFFGPKYTPLVGGYLQKCYFLTFNFASILEVKTVKSFEG
jgi:hypothetical protein